MTISRTPQEEYSLVEKVSVACKAKDDAWQDSNDPEIITNWNNLLQEWIELSVKLNGEKV